VSNKAFWRWSYLIECDCIECDFIGSVSVVSEFIEP